MAVFNPTESKRKYTLLLAAQYRPRTLQEFIQNSLWHNVAKQSQEKAELLTIKTLEFLKMCSSEEVLTVNWKETIKKLGIDETTFYRNLRPKLLATGMLRIVRGKYTISEEFSTQLEIINSLWHSFVGV